jgi:branched-chain amino acid transport system substrate-binding protein
VLYLRGLFNHIMVAEAVRNAQDKNSVKIPNSEQVREALESIKMDKSDWDRVGLVGFPEFAISCNDHEDARGVLFQQWDATAGAWKLVSDWIPVMRDVVRPMMEADAAKFAAENKITPRICG